MDNSSYGKATELSYQKERAASIGQVHPTPDYVIERYRTCSLWRLFPKECLFKKLGDAARGSVLDFGCGEGVISIQLAKLGFRVTAIDISDELIKIAERRADVDRVSEYLEFMVRDIMKYPLPKDRFDFAICNAVLHHLDIHLILPQILDSLKPNGMAIMVEPIAFSESLQKLRDALPISRDASPCERQLGKDELDLILGSLSNEQAIFFNLFSRISRLFPNRNKIDRGHPFTKTILILLGSLDRLLLEFFPSLSKFCGTVVITGRKRSV